MNHVLPYGVLQLPSASELARGAACPPSFVMEGIRSPPDDFAIRGTTGHSFIKAILAGVDRNDALSAIPIDDPNRSLCEDLDPALLPQGGSLEVAVAWNPETEEGRILGYDIGRDYEKHGADRAAELVGSADYVGILPGGVLVILDWKTGKKHLARDSWQLKGLAVFLAAAIPGISAVKAGLGFIRGDRITWDFIDFDALALAQARAKLREMVAAIAEASRRGSLEASSLQEGWHCTYCPSFKRCPAKVALMRSMAAAAEDLGGLTLSRDLPEDIAESKAVTAFSLLERVEQAAKHARAEIESFADRHPLNLGDGRWLKRSLGEMRDTVLDGPAAIRALAEETDDLCASAAIKTTKGAIEDAAAEYARRNNATISKVKKGVIEALRGRGLIAKLPGEERVRIVRTAPTTEQLIERSSLGRARR